MYASNRRKLTYYTLNKHKMIDSSMTDMDLLNLTLPEIIFYTY